MLIFFNDAATTEIYTLSLHDALPIFGSPRSRGASGPTTSWTSPTRAACSTRTTTDSRRSRSASSTTSGCSRSSSGRSEEHTSELQSRQYLVCRLLLEKKKPPSQHYLH